jgi:hypothetical protein
MHSFSQEAIERPRRALEVPTILRSKAPAIERATSEAHKDEIVVAVVNEDLSFGGVWTIAREEMLRQIPIVEGDGGWSFTFSAQTSAKEIEHRCAEYSRIATRRWDVMQRWISRHQSQ